MTLPRRLATDLIVAFQFLTRIPTPQVPFAPDSLARAAAFFPAVGLALGAAAALLHRLLAPHLSRPLAALAVIAALVLATGALHEDGLADAADGFGGGRDRDQTLLILRDSRIGSYGALALILSVLARVLLLSSVPLRHVAASLIAAETLSRWSSLPLTLLPAARPQNDLQNGQGARLAQNVSRTTLLVGTLLAAAVSLFALRQAAIAPILLTAALVALGGRYFLRRLGGVTGDCFGAVIQLTEIAVLCCGAWLP
jgi:adenosylcobinamide-GDP ribazoletransferase